MNTAGWNRDCLIEIDLLPKGMAFFIGEGNKLVSILLENGRYLVEVPNVPAFGWIEIIAKANSPEAEPSFNPNCTMDKDSNHIPLSKINLSSRTISTPEFTIEWDEKGRLNRVYCKEGEFEVLNGGLGNCFTVYEDKPELFDAWDIDESYSEKYENIDNFYGAQVIENSTLRTVVRFEFCYLNSKITQDICLARNNKRIDFITEVNWHESQKLVKVHFPVNVKANEATYDIQFGNIKRSTLSETSIDRAKFEVYGHQWVDLSQADRGVSLLNNCKYGHDITESRLGLTLIKSAIDPDPLADKGIHKFTYSLYPHLSGWAMAQTPREAFSLNSPPLIFNGRMSVTHDHILHLVGENIFVDALKMSEDGTDLIFRLHEYVGALSSFRVDFAMPIQSYCICDLLENSLSPWIYDDSINDLIKPYEIKTYKIHFNS